MFNKANTDPKKKCCHTYLFINKLQLLTNHNTKSALFDYSK